MWNNKNRLESPYHPYKSIQTLRQRSETVTLETFQKATAVILKRGDMARSAFGVLRAGVRHKVAEAALNC